MQDLETPLQLPFLAESGDPLVTLRAAAIVKEHWVYMFNLDESPATCDILSPFACSYKAKVSAEGVGTMKTLSVKHVAWSRKLLNNGTTVHCMTGGTGSMSRKK